MDASWTQAKKEHERLSWLFEIRPQVLAVAIGNLLAGKDRRRMVVSPEGYRLYLDPLSALGRSLLRTDTFEPGTREIFDRFIKPGLVVLDVGANEGYFSVVAAKLTGPTGRIICVEPQSRLIPILQKNLIANGIENASIVEAALGSADAVAEMFLATTMNNGASGLVRRFRWSREHQTVRTITPLTLLSETGQDHFDFVKVDVEGYEGAVVDGLLPILNDGRIGALLIDYHHSILEKHGISADQIHQKLIVAGMHETEYRTKGYKLYLRRET